MGNWQSNKSLPIEQETACSKRRNLLIAQDLDVSEELEHAEMQLEKRQRKVDEHSMVIYGQEQGSLSNSQLTFHLDWLSNNSALYPRVVILKEKVERLYARQSDVLTELEHAEYQPGQKQREEVRQWLTEVQRIKNKIQTMIYDGQGSSSNSNLSGSIESFIKEVDELIQRSKFPNGLVLSNQESTRFPLLLDIKPVGTSFQQNTEIILGWLQNHEHCIIGVYGMGGVGKTTLLTHIHDQLLQDSNLSHKIGHVYWVTVSQNCPVRKLQDDIAKALRLASFQEDDERKRAAVLHNRLAARGRTVLILDDMWEQVSGSKVGIPLENSNCKIILSTRLYDVCRKMGCKDFVIKAEILHEGEAWDLFVEKLGHYDTLEEEAKEIACDIAKECGGLPLAIGTMARSMTDVVDINEWKTTLNDLKSARDQADMKEDVFQILRYSYDRLNDKRVQECFLSCILYEEDAKIRRTTFIDLWINEGLLDDIKSRDVQVSKGHTILNKLESSCLLESVLNDAEEKCVKMHDLIRDMAIIITKEHPLFIAEAGKQLEQVPEEKWSKDLVKVSLSLNDIEEIPSGMAPMTPNLTVLMLKDNPLEEIPDSFFVHMNALTVLDLSGTYIKRVPERVSDLENLRGLLLAGCRYLIYVPSVAKLTKLRMLDLKGCRKLKEAPRGLERLTSVEKISYSAWDASDMIGFNKVIQSLTSLSCYRFWIRDVIFCESYYDDWFMFDKNEKVVRVTGVEFQEDKSSWLLPTTLECLEISECDMKGRSLGDVFPSLGEATGVKYIRIKDCRGLESISGSSRTQQERSPVSFSTTEVVVLTLIQLPDLRSISKSGVPYSFCHLQNIFVDGCPKLKVVFPMTFTTEFHLPELFRINVMFCEELEGIFETDKAILLKPLLVVPKLKSLIILKVPKIKMIFPFAEQLQFPDLDEIDIEKCAEMEEIFESNKGTLLRPLVDLSRLRSLRLRDLPKLQVIFPVEEQLQLPVLSIKCVEECEEVEETLGSNTAILSGPILSLSLSLPKLERLNLDGLPNIKVIFPFTEELHLPNLKFIRVLCGEEVEEIFESNKANLSIPRIILPKLQELSLYLLPKVKVIFPFTEELYLPNLEIITVSCCEEVEEIIESNKAHSKPILSLPKLNLLQVRGLPKLASIYRGRLRCTSLVNPGDLIINGCPKLKWWRLPGGDLISDEPCSSSTMLEFPPETHLPDPDYDNKIQWGASLSLSLPFHNHQHQ